MTNFSQRHWHDALAKCRPEDFDGHSEFHRLSPEQRLEWLDEMRAFIVQYRGVVRDHRETQ